MDSVLDSWEDFDVFDAPKNDNGPPPCDLWDDLDDEANNASKSGNVEQERADYALRNKEYGKKMEAEAVAMQSEDTMWSDIVYGNVEKEAGAELKGGKKGKREKSDKIKLAITDQETLLRSIDLFSPETITLCARILAEKIESSKFPKRYAARFLSRLQDALWKNMDFNELTSSKKKLEAHMKGLGLDAASKATARTKVQDALPSGTSARDYLDEDDRLYDDDDDEVDDYDYENDGVQANAESTEASSHGGHQGATAYYNNMGGGGGSKSSKGPAWDTSDDPLPSASASTAKATKKKIILRR